LGTDPDWIQRGLACAIGVSEVLLSAALIVKNEEGLLEDCLSSIQGIADEVVIADTGSTDRSRQIAQSAGAHVIDYPWVGDFAAARNAALDVCRGQWILYIDADERVRPCDGGDLRAWLEDRCAIGYRVLFHVRPGYTPYREMRLFRNHRLIRFEGVIHENIWPGILRYQARHGGEIGDCALTFDHFGYEGDQAHKFDRNLPLLLASLEQNPEKSFNWCHLAQIYEDLGQEARARAALGQGVSRVRARKRRGAVDSLPYARLIEFQLKRAEDSSALLKEALGLFPDNLQFHWFRARLLMEGQRFAEAIPLFEWLLERGRKRDYDQIAAYDARLFNVLSYDSLATCYHKLGRHEEAARFYELAASAEPDHIEYKLKARVCRDLAREGPPAEPPA
jgi:tetratricopeptide (TPR) repeat protein